MKSFLVAVLFSVTALVATRADSATAARPDLTGSIFAQDSTPVKEATIFIYTAGPKVGRGTL